MLIDCIEHPDSELLIVEGKSAANALKRGRDRRDQAVIALQGKIPNAKVNAARKLLENPSIINLLKALDSSWSGDLRVRKMRYRRLIILTDPDADGLHARVLVILLFFLHLKSIIELEHLYMGYAPLYSVDSTHLKAPRIAYTQKHYTQVLAELQVKGITDTVTTRYKGLAGMDQSMLRRCCLDKESRAIKLVTLPDCQQMLQLVEKGLPT